MTDDLVAREIERIADNPCADCGLWRRFHNEYEPDGRPKAGHPFRVLDSQGADLRAAVEALIEAGDALNHAGGSRHAGEAGPEHSM